MTFPKHVCPYTILHIVFRKLNCAGLHFQLTQSLWKHMQFAYFKKKINFYFIICYWTLKRLAITKQNFIVISFAEYTHNCDIWEVHPWNIFGNLITTSEMQALYAAKCNSGWELFIECLTFNGLKEVLSIWHASTILCFYCRQGYGKQMM